MWSKNIKPKLSVWLNTLKESEILFIIWVELPLSEQAASIPVLDLSQSGTDRHEGDCRRAGRGHKRAQSGYGGEIIAHTSSGRAGLNCPLGQGVGCEASRWVLCCVGGSRHRPLRHSLSSKSAPGSQNSRWHTMHVNNLWETWGGKAAGMFEHCYAERQCLYMEQW